MTAMQHGQCPLCERQMSEDTVVDHDHKSGMVRAVLCRWCNAMLGKLENWSGRIGQGIDPRQFLMNSAKYLLHHDANPSGVIYPTHKTPAEKKQATLERARKARVAKRKAAKEAENASPD